MPKGKPGSAAHGGSGGLYNDGCRCEPCRISHRARMLVGVQKRFRERVTGANGRPYAPRARVHGSPSTYGNWGCRCDPCLLAGSKHNQRQKEERALRRLLTASAVEP